MHGDADAKRRRILRVREAQRRIALGRVAKATQAVSTIDERRDLVSRLVTDTLPQASSYQAMDFIGRMRFAGRMAVAQTSLGQARIEAAAASDERVAELRRADTDVEIANRLLAAEAAQRRRDQQRRTLEDLSRSAKPSRRGSNR
jgi:hypothetical protein